MGDAYSEGLKISQTTNKFTYQLVFEDFLPTFANSLKGES
jgi:hypothetical protein